MSNKTSIQWTDKTLNTVTGCNKISQGCKFCYADSIATRFAGSKAFPNGFQLTFHPERLKEPLGWTKPAMCFVNSMSDFFHEDIPFDYIKQNWDVFQQTPQHTYQVLTKRAKRMLELTRELPVLPNVWLGVSVENKASMERISALVQTPAVVRFISAEPLLDDWLTLLPAYIDKGSIEWVILGGESGLKARDCVPAWISDGLAAVRLVGAAPFVKQMGTRWAKAVGVKDSKGGDITELPGHLQVREWPTPRPLQEVIDACT